MTPPDLPLALRFNTLEERVRRIELILAFFAGTAMLGTGASVLTALKIFGGL